MNSADLAQVHSIGYDLEEVKVTFNHDVKLAVSGVDIEGKQGEIINVPRWIAKVLESEKHVEVQEADMVNELKQAHVKENAVAEANLSTLEPHFYVKVNAYLEKLPQQDFERVHPLLRDLFRKRRSKIIQLADSLKLSAELSQKLTVEERSLYEKIYMDSHEIEKQILGDKK